MTTPVNRPAGRAISLVRLLEQLGYHPFRQDEHEYYYKSMLHGSGERSTLSINDRLGVWYDKQLGKGGSILEFAQVYFQLPCIEQALAKVLELCQPADDQRLSGAGRKRKPVKLPHYLLSETLPTGNHPEITAWLGEQGMLCSSCPQLREVYYYYIDQHRRRKYFYAAGWQNENGGWEVRSRNFSGCVGPEGMTFIPADPERLLIFEEFKDYLSWQQAFKTYDPSILVLNSNRFLEAARTRATKFKETTAFAGARHLSDQVIAAITQIPGHRIIHTLSA